MTSKDIEDYLTKQVLIAKNIVTFRSLSRELGLSVNIAKNELSAFHCQAKARKETLYATYLVSGTLKATRQEDKENILDEEGYDDPDADISHNEATSLAAEDQLDDIKSTFSKISCVHIYALSPSIVRDCAVLCDSENIRRIDREKGDAFAKVVGKVVGDDIKVIPEKLKKKPPAPPVAGPSVINGPDVRKAKASKDKAEELTKKNQPTLKAGKLDFSKAKASKAPTKESKDNTNKAPAGFFNLAKKEPKASIEKEEVKELPPPPKGKKFAESKPKAPLSDSDEVCQPETFIMKTDSAKKANERHTEDEGEPASKRKKNYAPKRPTKRKSTAPSSGEEAESAKETKKQKVATTNEDDEDDAPVIKHRRLKRKVADYDDHLESIFDKDDDVDVVHRNGEPRPPDTDADEDHSMKDDNEDDDIEMKDSTSDEDMAPVVPRKKRKAKPPVPIGKNGLKKRRVERTRETKDAKGYTITEDYSSYESVSEEETDEKPAPKKPRTKAKPREKVEEDEESDVEAKTASPPALKAKPGPKSKTANVKPKVTQTAETAKSKPKVKKAPVKQQGISAFFTKK